MWKILRIDRVIQKSGNQVENGENSAKIGRLGISAHVNASCFSACCVHRHPGAVIKFYVITQPVSRIAHPSPHVNECTAGTTQGWLNVVYSEPTFNQQPAWPKCKHMAKHPLPSPNGDQLQAWKEINSAKHFCSLSNSDAGLTVKQHLIGSFSIYRWFTLMGWLYNRQERYV